MGDIQVPVISLSIRFHKKFEGKGGVCKGNGRKRLGHALRYLLLQFVLAADSIDRLLLFNFL